MYIPDKLPTDIDNVINGESLHCINLVSDTWHNVRHCDTDY